MGFGKESLRSKRIQGARILGESQNLSCPPSDIQSARKDSGERMAETGERKALKMNLPTRRGPQQFRKPATACRSC